MAEARDQALVARMEALVRDMAASATSPGFAHYDWARKIAASLPEPLDPDVALAREIAGHIAGAVAEYVLGLAAKEKWVRQYEIGAYDNDPEMIATLAAIRRVREQERG